jgi:hypothetical protein
VDPDDPLAVDELIVARRRWDAQIAEARRRWDALYPTTTSAPSRDAPAAAESGPRAGGGGGRTPPTRVGDVGDWVDPKAPDPTPGEVTDPDHPDYVEPWSDG